MSASPDVSTVTRGYGPAAITFWWAGKLGQRSALELINMAFHTLAFPLWIVVPILGFYAYQHPLEYSSTSDCPKLTMYILTVSIVALIYVAFNLVSMVLQNSIFAATNLVCGILSVHAFMFVFAIVGSVWVFSAPGEYFKEAACSFRLVSGIQNYLIGWWVYFALWVIMISVYWRVILPQASRPDNSVEDPAVANEVRAKLVRKNRF